MSGLGGLALALALAQGPAPSPGAEPALQAAPVRPAAAPAGLLRFSHRVHTARKLATKCVDCHRLGVDGNRFRPSEEGMCTPCHKEKALLGEFRAAMAARPARPPRGPVEPIHRQHQYYRCERCHGGITASEKVGDQEPPPTDNTAEACVACHSRAVTFSHATHVRADGKVGADCALCHAPRPDGIWYGVPGHPQCWQCHDINLLGLTEGCNLCHLADTRAPKTYRIERASTLHKEHPREKVGCGDCHAGILTAGTLEELRAARETASEKACGRCHALPK